MIKRLQLLPPGVRIVVFIFMVVGFLLLLGGFTLLLLLLSVNGTPRQSAQTLSESVTVAEYAALPDNDSYPSTVAAGTDGVVYAASYATGTVWRVAADGVVTEIRNTRDAFDSVTALAVRPDNTLLVVAFTGGDEGAWAIHTLTAEGQIALFGTIDDARGFVSPFDMAIDAENAVYVVDRSRNEVWRWDADGENPELWWSMLTLPSNGTQAAAGVAPTGLAYDARNDALLVTDTDANTVIRIPHDRSASELVFQYVVESGSTFPPGFDGIAITPDGVIYITALDQKGVAMFTGDAPYTTASFSYIAGNFRGPSDLALLPDGRLIVANFDSVSLVQPGVSPQLPFGLDVLTFE